MELVNIKVTPRERDTILAALRFYQANIGAMPHDFLDIAENDRSGKDAVLDAGEIDVLCEEKVNVGPSADIVYVATYEHRHGTDVQTFADEEGATKWRQVIAAEWWDQEMGDRKKPDDPEELAKAYFDRMGDQYGRSEYFNIEKTEVER